MTLLPPLPNAATVSQTFILPASPYTQLSSMLEQGKKID